MMPDVDKEQFYTFIGQNIRKAREKASINQETLAKLVGLTRVSIVNIEKARQHPPLHLLWSIAKVLNTTLRDLLPPEDMPSEHKDMKLLAERTVEEKIKKQWRLEGDPSSEAIQKIRTFIEQSMKQPKDEL